MASDSGKIREPLYPDVSEVPLSPDGMSSVVIGNYVDQYDAQDENGAVARLRHVSFGTAGDRDHSVSPAGSTAPLLRVPAGANSLVPPSATGAASVAAEPRPSITQEQAPLLNKKRHSDEQAPLPVVRRSSISTSPQRGRDSSPLSRSSFTTMQRPVEEDDVTYHHQQRVHLEEDLYANFYGYRTVPWKTVLYYLGGIFTAGLLFLLCRWFPKLWLRLRSQKCGLRDADVVMVENSWKELECVRIRRVPNFRSLEPIYYKLPRDPARYSLAHVPEGSPLLHELCVIEYHCVVYFMNPLSGLFVQNTLWKGSVNLDAHINGLEKEEREDRWLIYGPNRIAIPEKSTFQLLVDEILHPFYLFQIFSIALWCADNYYYYAACIFVISTSSAIFSLFETKENISRLRNMAHLEVSVNVFRGGYWKQIDASELIPGDIYEISSQMRIVPCDTVLLSGDALVNESMLTGESLPVAKAAAGDEDILRLPETGEINSKFYLFCGTQFIRARPASENAVPVNSFSKVARNGSIGMVVRTGFNSVKGGLIRSMLFPKPNKFKFYEDSFRFLGVLVIIAMLGFGFSLVQFIHQGVPVESMIKRALDLITIVIPPALPAAMSIGTSFALSRLKRSQIYCISPPRVNVSGKLNLVVFDKTGTLTEDGLDVLGVLPANLSSPRFGKLCTNIADLERPAGQLQSSSSVVEYQPSFLHALATCHSINHVNTKLIGDPLDLKMFDFTNWELEESPNREEQVATTVRPKSNQLNIGQVFNPPSILQPIGTLSSFPQLPENELGIIRTFDFVPALRRMSVIYRQLSKRLDVVVAKGAPEVICDICVPSSVPEDFHQVLEKYTKKGYRVLACASRPLTGINWRNLQKISRETVERDLHFLGLVIFENKLKPETAPVLQTLRDAKIRSVMCTGDNVLTAISVSKESGLVDPRSNIFIPRLEGSVNGGIAEHLLYWELMDDPSIKLDPYWLTPTQTLTPVGESLNTSTTNSFTQFNEINLSSKIGKNLETVLDFNVPSAVGQYDLAITGEVFEHILQQASTETIQRLLVKGTIYARMSPDQKFELVERLQEIGYCVSMCGDGANDVSALKSADVGISLSNEEASVAAPFTSNISNISCVLNVIREGRAALVTSFSCFKYMALYSMIQFTTVTILYTQLQTLGDFQFLMIDLLLILPLAIVMGRVEGCERIHTKRPTASLVSKKVLTPLIGQVLLQLSFQIVVFLNVQRQPWNTVEPGHTDIRKKSHENTALFLFSCFQYIAVAIAFSVGPPYRKRLTSNALFVGVLVFSTLACVYFTLMPDARSASLLGLYPLPRLYSLLLIAFAAIYAVLAIMFESYVFPRMAKGISLVVEKCGKMFFRWNGAEKFHDLEGMSSGQRAVKKHRKPYKRVQEEMRRA